MTEVPSVKGSVLTGLIQTILKHRGNGEITDADVQRVLAPEDHDLLESTIMASFWYPIASYDRMNQVLLETIAHGDPEYLVDLGRETAVRLIESGGLYAQLEFLQRTEVAATHDPHERWEGFGRDLFVLCTLHRAMLNFGEQRPIPDPDHPQRWITEVTEARHYPDTYALRCKGFVNEMARRYGEPDLWTWDRPTPDLVHWRMVRDL